jgi:hypothetical protein
MNAAPLDMASASIGENKTCIILPFVFDGKTVAVNWRKPLLTIIIMKSKPNNSLVVMWLNKIIGIHETRWITGASRGACI